MTNKKEINYFEVLSELKGCIKASIDVKKGIIEYLNPEFEKREIVYEKRQIAKMEEQIEAINHAIDMIYS